MSRSPENITELIAALEGLGKRNLNDEYDLFWSCRNVFEKLKRLSDFDPGNVKKTINVLKSLPPEIKELKIDEIDSGEQKLESKALNKQELKDLLEEYEKANDEQKEKIVEKFYQKTGHRNIQDFLRVQKEITSRNQEKLDNIKPEIKEKVIENLAVNRLNGKEKILEIIEKAGLKNDPKEGKQEIERELKKNGYDRKEIEQIIEKSEKLWSATKTQTNQEEINQINPEEIKENIGNDLVKNSQDKNEKVFEIIEKASLKGDQEYKAEELKKELKKRIKNPEEIENLILRVEEIRAEIKVENKAEEIADNTYKRLLEEKLPVDKSIKEKIKKEVLAAWKEGDEVKIPEKLEEIPEAKVIIKEAKKATDLFKNENIKTIVNYRSLELGKAISQELRESGVQNETLIREYVEVVNKLTNNPENAKIEENRNDIYNFIKNESPDKGPGEIERSIDEARFMAGNVVMAPKKFNRLIQKYNILREKIGSDKLPKIKEVRVVEKMASLFKNSPKLLKLMNGAQKVMGVWEKINVFPSNLVGKLGGKIVEKYGSKILERIGGQVAVDFVKNAAAVIAKEGTVQGIKSIALGLMGKGAVAVGGSAGAGAGVASVVTAFQALPVVGQVVAVVAVVVVAAVKIVKPIIDTTKKFLEKILGTSLNKIKKFVSEDLGLGKFIGNVSQFVFDLAVFFVGIPKLLGLIKFGATLAPIFVIFFAGIFLYNMQQHQLISSIVPPEDLGVCILKRGSGPGGLSQSGEINCDMNAPENEVPGLISKENYFRLNNEWTSGKSHVEECYNDVVNRSLCAGINPLYSLWVWMHESAASNYDIGRIQDFGINDDSIAENFDAQIKVFLRLDPASACIDDPKIKGDYWLAFATNFLTGQCDPDFPHPKTGQTGRGYLESTDPNNPGMKITWKWMANVPLPDNIFVAKGGQNCEAEGAPFSLTGPTREIVGDDGQIYLCTISGGGGGAIGTINIIPGQAGTGGPVTQCPFGSFTHRSIWAMDFGVPNGTPIYSTFAGVAYVGEGNGYGVYVDVHSNIEGDEFFIRYAHMPPGGNIVSNGQTVEAGQQIGNSDDNGFSTGPHLHYEVVGADIDWNNAGPYFGMTQEEFNSACRGG